MIQKISPFLWFDKNAEEAINFYTSIFKNSKIVNIARYPDNVDDEHMKGMEGKVITAVFELEGQSFMALDGGPIFTFNESISFRVDCENQEEVDYYWKKLSAVPESEQCGWLKDKFGVSWQIIPRQLGELMEKDKSGKVMTAMLQMKKIEVKVLEDAYKGKSS